MKEQLLKILANFKGNTERIKDLLAFDELVQAICLSALKKAQKGLQGREIEKHPSFRIDSLVQQIEKIRDNDSLQPHYRVMYNQCIVLLVSYFSSAVEDVFRVVLSDKISQNNLGSLKNEEIKITLEQYCEDKVVDIFLDKKDINFQDMNSTRRSFEKYLDFEAFDRNAVMANIILAQAMRHCIVHSGCAVSRKAIAQLVEIKNRTLKANIQEYDTIQFTEEEVLKVKDDMLSFMIMLANKAMNNKVNFRSELDTPVIMKEAETPF